MKKRYVVAIIIAIVAVIGIIRYNVDMPHFSGRKLMMNRSFKWSFTGASFVTTFTDQHAPVTGAKTTHTCLAGNDESCFTITVRSGNYASYFNAYRIAMFEQMMATSGSTITDDDLKAQLRGGYHQVREFIGTGGSNWHLVDIGMEAQHLYIERPWGTLIVVDTLGLKGPSYEDRTYMPYTEMPEHIVVQ